MELFEEGGTVAVKSTVAVKPTVAGKSTVAVKPIRSWLVFVTCLLLIAVKLATDVARVPVCFR